MPVDRAVLEQELSKVPDSTRWLARPEVPHLATILDEGEKVQLGVTGWVVESGKLAMRTWLVLATSDRLLCLLGGGENMKKLQISIADMKNAHTDARLGYYEVTVESRTRKLILSGLPKEAAVNLSAVVSTLISRRDEVASAPTRVPAAAPAAIVESNAVTREEVQAYVQKLERLEAELEQTKQRLAAVEQVIRNAQAKAAAAAAAKKPAL